MITYVFLALNAIAIIAGFLFWYLFYHIQKLNLNINELIINGDKQRIKLLEKQLKETENEIDDKERLIWHLYHGDKKEYGILNDNYHVSLYCQPVECYMPPSSNTSKVTPDKIIIRTWELPGIKDVDEAYIKHAEDILSMLQKPNTKK